MVKLNCPQCGKEIETTPVLDEKKELRLRWIIINIGLVNLLVLIIIAVLFALRPVQLTSTQISNPYDNLNISFQCVDGENGNNIEECNVHLKIVEETRLDEFDLNSLTGISTLIPIKRRLALNVTSQNYKTTSEIFEYIDDGSLHLHEMKLEKIEP